MRKQGAQTSWAAGEISPRLRANEDLEPWKQSARKLDGALVTPQGTLAPFPGSLFVKAYTEPVRTIAFHFSSTIVYDLVFYDELIDVFADGALLTTIDPTPWATAHLDALQVTQRNDEMYIVHPEVEPKILVRLGDTSWEIRDWPWYANTDRSNRVEYPHHKFEQPAVTLDASATTGSVTVTARQTLGGGAADIFTASHVGVRLRIKDRELTIDSVAAPPTNVATCTVVETLVDHAETAEWTEQAVSGLRGWPTYVDFYQQRLTLTTRDAPNALWHSRTEDFFNFESKKTDGTVLATHAIKQTINSKRFQQIVGMAVRKEDQLVLTNGGLWQIGKATTSDGFAPDNHEQVQLHTIGGIARTLTVAGGAGLYVPTGGKGLYENAVTRDDRQAALLTRDQSLLAEHLFSGGIEQVELIESPYRMLVLRTTAGGLVLVTYASEQQVFAPVRRSFGDWLVADMSVLRHADGDKLRLVLANGDDRLFCAMAPMDDQSAPLHAAVAGYDATPKTVWSGLDHLEGAAVWVDADNGAAFWEDLVVDSGEVTLPRPANSVRVGLHFPADLELQFVGGDPGVFPRITTVKELGLLFGDAPGFRRIELAMDNKPLDTLWWRTGTTGWVRKALACDARADHHVRLVINDPAYWELHGVAYDYEINPV